MPIAFKLEIPSEFTHSCSPHCPGPSCGFNIAQPTPFVPRVRTNGLSPDPSIVRKASVSPPSLKCNENEVAGCDPQHDQYGVPHNKGQNRFVELAEAVLVRGCCVRPNGRHLHSVLGDYGHLERFSAWSHIVATATFLVYGVVRSTVFHKQDLSNAFSTAAAFAQAFTFFASSIYHLTAPDRMISKFTRQLDYLGIYIGLSVAFVADVGAATHGFQGIPTIAFVDVPLAVSIVAAFFAVRRYELSADDTEVLEYGDCTLGRGLFRRWHTDGLHAGLRQASSLTITLFYFTSTPSSWGFLGGTAYVVLVLQLSAFGLVVLGMTLDYTNFPDSLTHRTGRALPCTSFPICGCFIGAHGLWHLIAVAAAVLTAIARELALLTF